MCLVIATAAAHYDRICQDQDKRLPCSECKMFPKYIYGNQNSHEILCYGCLADKYHKHHQEDAIVHQ